ncbi:uncharacterized protein LOC135836884 [Planococcus citri]|uniref:uncharacterized protein LOC135836884 n=1 Tax=Planococcus citri TaxID=170843 RepID=UPI0031F80CB6
MYRERVKIFCFVIGAIALVLSGRDIEAGVTRNEPESSNDGYPFVDGLRINSQRNAIDTSDLEERDTESSIVDGLHKIPRQFELPSDVDPEGEPTESNYEEFPAPVEESEKPVSLLNNESPKEGNVGEFPFLNGLRKHSSTDNEKSKVGEEYPNGDEIPRRSRLRDDAGGFPFRDGLRRKPQDDGSKTKDFQTTNEEYPFVNGLRRLPGSASESENSTDESEVEGSRSLVDDIPVKENLPESNDEVEEFSVTDKADEEDSNPIKKRSVEDDEYGGPEPTTTEAFLPEDVNNDTRHVTKIHLFPTTKPRPPGHVPTRYMVSFGQEYANQSQLLERWAYKPIPAPAVFDRLITEETYPSKGRNNTCPINYILVRNVRKYDHLYTDNIKVIDGGIGETHVTLRITSYNTYLYKYLIFIYGLCKVHQDYPNMKDFEVDQIWTPDA